MVPFFSGPKLDSNIPGKVLVVCKKTLDIRNSLESKVEKQPLETCLEATASLPRLLLCHLVLLQVLYFVLIIHFGDIPTCPFDVMYHSKLFNLNIKKSFRQYW